MIAFPLPRLPPPDETRGAVSIDDHVRRGVVAASPSAGIIPFRGFQKSRG